ncbi:MULTISPECIES: hypothetical protein [Halorussus]|uniref:hypothetical protein n=1 Tax=Halorussus TaxID=1070314 RepID=UPI0013B3BE48|nr:MULTISPECIES: hypothetical protein [Halorussus]NHN60232.1 hypothetical protein [Halorussus sp. JP-T4]
MSRGMAVAALAVCVLVAGCGGLFADGERTEEPTDGTTRDATANGERVLAAPPDSADNASDGAETGTGGTEGGGTSTAGSTATATSGSTGSATSNTAGSTTGAALSGPTTAEPAELTTTGRTNGTETATRATFDRDVGYEVRVSNAGSTPRNVTVRIVAANDSAVAFAESIPLGPNESVTFDVVFPYPGAFETEVSVGGETETRRWEVAERNPDEALSVHVSESGEVYLGFVAI